MKFVMTIDCKEDPDAVGEFLRRNFFAEKIGCYNCFDWEINVRSLEPRPVILGACVDDQHEFEWTRGERSFLDGIDAAYFVECRYYWDGDGHLEFIFPDGARLVNTDCKHYRGWGLIPADEHEQRG